MGDTNSELHSIVHGIVCDLEAAAAGTLICDDGNYEVIGDIDEWKKDRYEEMEKEFRQNNSEEDMDHDLYDSYEEWMEDEIGTIDDIDDPEKVSLGEYVDNQSLGDVRFEVDEDLDLCGGKVLFCYGGPNVWVHDDQVCGYWGCDSVEMCLDSATSAQLWGWFEDLWSTKKEMMG